MSHTKHTLDMRTIVTPERIIWRFASQAAFEDWMLNNVRVQAHQRKNYRQLLGYDELPNDHVNKREAYNHFALEDTTWMYHADMPFTIPLFGTNPQKYAQLKGTATINMSLATFKRRLSSPRRWRPAHAERLNASTRRTYATRFDVNQQRKAARMLAALKLTC